MAPKTKENHFTLTSRKRKKVFDICINTYHAKDLVQDMNFYLIYFLRIFPLIRIIIIITITIISRPKC